MPVRCCSVRSSGSDWLDLYVPPMPCFPIFTLIRVLEIEMWEAKLTWALVPFFFLCVWVMPDFMGVEFLADMSWCINFCIGYIFQSCLSCGFIGWKTLNFNLFFVVFAFFLCPWFLTIFLWASKILVWIYFEWWHYNTNLLEWRSLAICRGSINQI